MELSLTDITFVLEVGVIDAPAILVSLNVTAFNTENLNAVRKK